MAWRCWQKAAYVRWFWWLGMGMGSGGTPVVGVGTGAELGMGVGSGAACDGEPAAADALPTPTGWTCRLLAAASPAGLPRTRPAGGSSRDTRCSWVQPG